MADEHSTISDSTYGLLDHMRVEQQEMRLDVPDMKVRASACEEDLAAIMMSKAGINTRLDRVDERLGRVERRLELCDGAEA